MLSFSLGGRGEGLFADATDNVIGQTATTMVEINADEILFATNRCTNFSESNGPNISTVYLYGAGAYLMVTGNRVHSKMPGPSLKVIAYTALSAVGNICSGGMNIMAPTPTKDQDQYNANVNVNV
jgi:hypothetical protein